MPREATKFSQYLLDSDKRYRVIARLGQRTDTSDADGQIVEERPVTFSAEQLAAALDTFRGDIEQIPSMYSALKYQGKKLYEYARQGIEVPREARPITVYELLFIRHEGNELELEIHCSKAPISALSLTISAKNSVVARMLFTCVVWR